MRKQTVAVETLWDNQRTSLEWVVSRTGGELVEVYRTGFALHNLRAVVKVDGVNRRYWNYTDAKGKSSWGWQR